MQKLILSLDIPLIQMCGVKHSKLFCSLDCGIHLICCCSHSLFSMQIEHHLFPGVCHIYYPEIHPIVKMTCKEFNVPYNCFPTVTSQSVQYFRSIVIYYVSFFTITIMTKFSSQKVIVESRIVISN